MKKLLLTFTIFLTILSCAGEEDSVCEGLNECPGETVSAARPKANVSFLPSTYFNVTTGSFINADPTANGDIVFNSLQVLSEDLVTSYVDAMVSIESSLSDPSLSTSIPHMIINIDNDKILKIRYTKRDGNGRIIEQRDNFPLERLTPKNGRVIIPVVNEFFAGNLVNPSDNSGNTNSFSHEVEIFALADGFEPSDRKRASFRLFPQRKPASANLVISDDIRNFNIEDRWASYFNEIDYVPNEDFVFFNLIDNKEVPDLFGYDIKFIFRSEPSLKMRQKVFFEETFDALLYATSGTRFYRRGESFFVNEQTFDSERHFNKKFKINDQVVFERTSATNSARELELRNVEGGTRWNLEFSYDFSKSSNFPVGADLLSPLRPECNNVTNQAFSPLQEQVLSEDASAQNGLLITCHPDTNQREILEEQDLINPQIALDDLWYKSFFYRPSSIISNTSSELVVDVGSFYGVKEVEFFMSGCVKVLIREASDLEVNPNIYEEKQLNSPECASESDEEGGWMYFETSVTKDIFQNRFEQSYSGNSNIIGLIEKLFTIPENTYPRFYFNGSFDVSKIY